MSEDYFDEQYHAMACGDCFHRLSDHSPRDGFCDADEGPDSSTCHCRRPRSEP